MIHTCPWWSVYTFDNPLRRLVHNPRKIFGPYVEAGMTVMDIGCGRGFNSVGLARIVGPKGRVISVDVQQEMLDMLGKRIRKTDLAGRIQVHRCEPDSIGVKETVSFVNAFWMVHEVPDTHAFLEQVHSVLEFGGKLLIAEPLFHVSSKAFRHMIEIAQTIGFVEYASPRVAFSKCVVLAKE